MPNILERFVAGGLLTYIGRLTRDELRLVATECLSREGEWLDGALGGFGCGAKFEFRVLC